MATALLYGSLARSSFAIGVVVGLATSVGFSCALLLSELTG